MHTTRRNSMHAFRGRVVGYTASGLLGGILAIAVSSFFLAAFPDCRHWFVVPLTACGGLVAVDAIHWLRGGYDTFHPYGLFGCFGFLAFQVIPLLHVAWNMFAEVPNSPNDWNLWLGSMAWVNALGLVLLHATRRLFPLGFVRPPKTIWRMSGRRLAFFAPPFLAVSLLLQIYAIVAVGGVSGMTERRAMEGMGFVLLIGESFPVLVIFTATLKWRMRDEKLASLGTVVLFFSVLLLLTFLLAGLRGSRSLFIGLALVLACTVHLKWRPIPRNILLASIVPVFVFMTVYGLYKDMRRDILTVQSYDDYVELASERRNWRTTILWDLGRSDIQAILLSHACSPDARLRYGETYLQAISLAIPRPVRPNFVPKSVAGTYALYGVEVEPNSREVGPAEGTASRVYGLAGEAMLNFGVIAAPLAFVAFAIWQTGLSVFPQLLDKRDVRILFFPLLFTYAIHMNGDMNNIIAGLIASCAFPFLFLFLVSERRPLHSLSADAPHGQ